MINSINVGIKRYRSRESNFNEIKFSESNLDSYESRINHI